MLAKHGIDVYAVQAQQTEDAYMTKDKGKAKGGIARAKALTPEQRSSIATKGAVARWGEKPLIATHKGSFKEEFGIDVECYVLNDEQKTAVISQRGMGAALGLGESGSRLTEFTKRNKMAPYVGRELAEKLSKPLVFQWSAVGANTPPNNVNGYDVTILIDLCKAISSAAADGVPLSGKVVKQASIIVNASAKAGIKGLVYALAGYDQTKAEAIAAYKFYVREEARDYEKEFPDELYAEWYRLYQLPKPERNKPWKFMHLTRNQVYAPLAKSNGKILELIKAQRSASDDRRAKLHQFLAGIGVKALRMHLGRLLGMAQISETEQEYERHVEKVFGVQQSFDIE